MDRPLVAVCLKAVELRAGVDPLTGRLEADPASLGLSPADEAALEWALCSAERYGGRLLALSAGPPSCEVVLRRARAAGADEVLRLCCEPDWPSEWVAAALSAHLGEAQLVWCGDLSFDRGSGSVPCFIAEKLQAPQALGVVEVTLKERLEDGLEALRRLDGGRRERLSVGPPAVVSVEGSSARLRRSSLRAVIAEASHEVPFLTGEKGHLDDLTVTGEGPYRPPARVVPGPPGDGAFGRVTSLVSGGSRLQRTPARRLEPEQAAREIIEALENWGEI
jgi:electron transfer flavoprotein beta subunit